MTDSKEKKPFTLDRTVRLVIGVIVIGGILFLVNYLRSVLLPFVIACVIAYIIHPFVIYNKKLLHLKGKVLPVIVTLFEIAFLLSIIGGFFFPYIINEIADMADMFSQYTKSHVNIPYLPDTIHDFIVRNIDFRSISKMLSQDQIVTFIEDAFSEIWSIMGSSIRVVLSVLSWFIVLLYLVFILIDYDSIMSGFKSLIPPKYNKIALQVIGDIQLTMNHYFRGQALVSFIVGILFSIGFLIMGLPLAVVFGLFIGILNMVPYLQLISIPFAALLCLVMAVNTGQNFWVLFGEAIAIYCICQVIQDMLLTPKIMGKYMGLNPAIIFLSLSVWGTLLGFIGFIIALPLTTLVISYYDRYVIHKDALDILDGKGPEESEPETPVCDKE